MKGLIIGLFAIAITVNILAVIMAITMKEEPPKDKVYPIQVEKRNHNPDEAWVYIENRWHHFIISEGAWFIDGKQFTEPNDMVRKGV